MILSIETSTPICSVALAKGAEILAIRESYEGLSHAELTAVFIEEVMREAKVQLADLEAVAVSKGPGSYTGLRIGVSTAKGLCYALNKPLIAVSSLQALARAATAYYTENQVFIPMIDARRMEVYAGVYDAENQCLREVQADIIDERSYSEFAENQIVMLGDGAKKCAEIFKNNARITIDETLKFSAKHMAYFAQKALENGDFEDVAYFEPFYLKDFVAGKPHVKGLK